jgi:Mrp family chromosome partitioning ATPase
VILVARIDKTDKTVLKHVLETFKTSPVNLLGLVVNGEKFRGVAYNYNYNYTSKSSVVRANIPKNEEVN